MKSFSSSQSWWFSELSSLGRKSISHWLLPSATELIRSLKLRCLWRRLNSIAKELWSELTPPFCSRTAPPYASALLTVSHAAGFNTVHAYYNRFSDQIIVWFLLNFKTIFPSDTTTDNLHFNSNNYTERMFALICSNMLYKHQRKERCYEVQEDAACKSFQGRHPLVLLCFVLCFYWVCSPSLLNLCSSFSLNTNLLIAQTEKSPGSPYPPL